MRSPGIILCLIAAALTGCAKTQFVLRAGVRGMVVDARTGRPIPRAVVCVENAVPTAGLAPRQATTWSGDDGRFDLRPLTRLRTYRQYRERQGTTVSPLIVSRAGYATRRLEARTPTYTTEPGAVVDTGKVELQPLARSGNRQVANPNR